MIPILRNRDLQKAISCAMDNWIIVFFSFPLLILWTNLKENSQYGDLC